MTQPSPHGYPDWGRYSASADKEIDNQVWADMDVATTFGPYFVGDVEWVNIVVTASAQHFRYRMQFRSSNVAIADMHNQEFIARSVGLSFLSFPVTGPWLFILVTPSAINSTGGFILTSGRRGGNPVNGNSIPNVLISRVNTAVGAGATVTVDATTTYPGPALWNLFVTPAAWTANIDSLDENAVTTRLDTVDNTVGKSSRQLYLPYQPIRLSVTNTSGAGGVFNATVMGVPNWPMVG